MDFGKSFKFYRQKANLTQKEAAEKIGINDYQLGNYETNRSQPSLEILKKMSKVYLVSIDTMLGNNMLVNRYARERKEGEYIDRNELAARLRDIVNALERSDKNKK